MKQKQGCGHLTNRVPNNFITRWLIKKVNNHMLSCGSMWSLKIRYRKPVNGSRYGRFGSLRREEAKKIALYLRKRQGYYSSNEWYK